VQVAQLVAAAGGVDADQHPGLVQLAHHRVDTFVEGGVLAQRHDVLLPAPDKRLDLVVGNSKITHGVGSGHSIGEFQLLVGGAASQHLLAGQLKGVDVVAGIDSGSVQIKNDRAVVYSLHKFLL